MPRWALATDFKEADPPQDFLERLTQARLASFWRSFAEREDAQYDAEAAEERYEEFCNEFLTQLPAVFALQPSKEWDERRQKLPVQRQMLHVAIFHHLCHNFRQVLMSKPGLEENGMVRALLGSQKRALAAAALKTLDSVSKLHALLGSSHTRFPAIILPTFEAAVILLSLVMDMQFRVWMNVELGDDAPGRGLNIDPLEWEEKHMTLDRCLRAVQDAHARLEMLAEVSNMSMTGARTVASLMAKMSSS
jgi:hypothetical protein